MTSNSTLNYPNCWHSRGYGLFAANPLGIKDFTENKTSLKFSLESGRSITFRYRVIISSDLYLTNNEINALTNDFARKYEFGTNKFSQLLKKA